MKANLELKGIVARDTVNNTQFVRDMYQKNVYILTNTHACIHERTRTLERAITHIPTLRNSTASKALCNRTGNTHRPLQKEPFYQLCRAARVMNANLINEHT